MSQPQINVTPASPYGSAAQQGAAARQPPGGSLSIDAPAPPGSGFSYRNSPYPSSSPSPSAFAPTINLTGKPSNKSGGGDGNQILAKLQAYLSHVEDLIEQYSHPIKPYLAGLGRFLIVVKFYKDALRIITQWSDQLYFLQRHQSFPWGLSHTLIISNVVVMAVCSSFIIAKNLPTPSVVGLLVVVISQGIRYRLISDVNFFLQNLSVIGGLLMPNNPKANAIFASLPTSIGTKTERRTYLQLAGRTLLILLFIGFLASGKFTPICGLVPLIGLLPSLMVMIGFIAKWSVMFLVLVLLVLNIIVNNWWSVHSAHPQRDFLKYDFFQALSIVGRLLLLVNMGPGGISVDEKKKVYY
ncbi:SURF4 family-domain-containing protein [Phakopsora pachyrhizi]|nr:SURF4 family-domain-containing protein [Phakopsora pachyrhizi]